MALQKLSFKPGVVKEITQYTNSPGWIDADKVRFRSGYPETIGGWTLVEPSAVSGVCRSLHQWSLLNGQTNLGIGTNLKYYILNSDTFYDITPSGFVAGSADAAAVAGYGSGGFGTSMWGGSGTAQLNSWTPLSQPLIWHHDNFGQDLVLNPRGGPIYYWSALTGLSAPANLLSTLSTAGGYIGTDVPAYASGVFVSPNSQAVVALGCTPYSGTSADPMQIRWSDLANALSWTPSRTNSAGGQRLASGSYIVGWVVTFQETLIWTDTSLYAMDFNSTYVFSFRLITNTVSLISPNAAISNGNSVFWMDTNSFWTYNGSVSELPSSLKSFVFGNLNRTQSWKVFAGHNHNFSEVWWFYPSKNSKEVDSYVLYNYLDQTWSHGTLARTAWLDIGRIPNPIAIDPNGYLYFHESGTDANGSPLSSHIESTDIDLNGGDQYLFLQRVIPDMQFLGASANNQAVQMDLYKRNGGSSKPKVRAATASIYPGTSQIWMRARGRRLSVKYSSNKVGTGWRLGTQEYDIAPDGKR